TPVSLTVHGRPRTIPVIHDDGGGGVGGGTAGDESEDDCDGDEDDCADIDGQYNTVYQAARNAWEMTRLEARARVEITVTDHRYNVKTEDGFRKMTFQVPYVQVTEAEWDPSDGQWQLRNYEEGKYSWSGGS
ncbi:MAG: hypothetical protein SVW77_03435, partial [Candidatus Nanohaloarchaea archaeon]|nr:hypothetical protein [Candidatus Nanohaloarchaea archaeon]